MRLTGGILRRTLAHFILGVNLVEVGASTTVSSEEVFHGRGGVLGHFSVWGKDNNGNLAGTHGAELGGTTKEGILALVVDGLYFMDGVWGVGW